MKRNRNEFSYGLRRYIEIEGKIDANSALTLLFHQFLVIGKNYWKLEFVDHKEDIERKVILLSNDSKQSDWLLDDYRMAFSLLKGSEGQKNRKVMNGFMSVRNLCYI